MFSPALLFSIKTFFSGGKRKVWPFLLRRSRTRIFRKDTVDSRMAQESLLSPQPLHGLIEVPAIHGKLPRCFEVTTILMFFEEISVPPPHLWIHCMKQESAQAFEITAGLLCVGYYQCGK